MHLYSLNLVPGRGVNGALYGNFSGLAKVHEIVVAHNNRIELLRIDSQGLAKSICFSDVFGVIRSIASLKTSGMKKHRVVVGSDSGRLVILEFTNNRFHKTHCDTYGKSGCRRLVPGQYVATDPSGRVILLSAVEKQKFVYNVTRDTSNKLFVASPLEAHKQNTLVFDVVGLDVALENPMFACLEVSYGNNTPSSVTPRNIVYYEVEAGLNHVVRKEIQVTLENANMLIPVPGGADGPGGLLVCGENYIQYHNIALKNDDTFYRVTIPRRCSLPKERSTLLVSYAMNLRKTAESTSLFFLVQSEYGDLFKIDLDFPKQNPVLKSFSVKYFDTIGVAKSLCITRRGFLFAANEFGRHEVFKFDHLGESDKTDLKEFTPHNLKNLSITDTIESFAPATNLRVAELCGEERNQIYITSGRGSRSSLNILRHGLEVTEMAVSDLPGIPSAVWTIKDQDTEDDKFIVVSFANVTLVLSIGETVAQAPNSGGLLSNVQTLSVGRFHDGSIVQVHPTGIHRVSKDGSKGEGWDVPPGKRIECGCVNDRQVVVALEGGNIYYFELDESQKLNRLELFDLGEDVKCMDLGSVPQGRVRSPFLAIGTFSSSVQVLSLDPSSRMKQVSAQALPDQPSSLALVNMSMPDGKKALTLCVGLRNGVLVRTQLSEETGAISDSRTQFLGPGPVRCFRIQLPCEEVDSSSNEASSKQDALLALSTRPWICYLHQNLQRVVSLSYSTLTYASNFNSDICEGMVGISGSTLRIFSLQDLSQTFNTKRVKLSFTPRDMLIHNKVIIVVEGDHGVLGKKAQDGKMEELRQKSDAEFPDLVAGGNMTDDDDDDDEKDEIYATNEGLNVEQLGLFRSGPSGSWASLVRMIDANGETKCKVELGKDELAVSCCIVEHTNGTHYLVVGTVTGMQLHPQSMQSASLRVYSVVGDYGLDLVHVTPVPDGIPRAMCQARGKLIVGVGNVVRVYAFGTSKLLRKSELKCMPNCATYLKCVSNRIFATDSNSSVHLLTFSSSNDMRLDLFADDCIPKLCVTGEVLDYDTVGVCDKFGNVSVLRLPSDVNDSIADVENTHSNRLLWDQRKLNGAPNKFQQLTQYYVGELVTSMQKTALVPGKSEALVYCSIMGTVGCLIPFASKQDIEMFSLLEMHLRNTQTQELVGREHLPYRSYYSPVKNVIDGDLCETFRILSPEKQVEIAKELDRSPQEVIKKIEDFRNKFL